MANCSWLPTVSMVLYSQLLVGVHSAVLSGSSAEYPHTTLIYIYMCIMSVSTVCDVGVKCALEVWVLGARGALGGC